MVFFEVVPRDTETEAEVDEAAATELDPDETYQGEERDILTKVGEKMLWAPRVRRLQKNSPYGNRRGWQVQSCIVKEDDDLRQERFASQLLTQFHLIFREFNLALQVFPYDVVPLSGTSGLIQTIPDAITLATLRTTLSPTGRSTLLQYFTAAYGGQKTTRFKDAQHNFARSLAGYSLFCYLLKVKDRHDDNIMITKDGYIVHIDFGEMLSRQMAIEVEDAPFKLTSEFVEVMGGQDSTAFHEYKALMKRGFLKLRKRYYQIEMLVSAMQAPGNHPVRCVSERTVDELLNRFQLYLSKTEATQFMEDLISSALANVSTRAVDWLCVGTPWRVIFRRYSTYSSLGRNPTVVSMLQKVDVARANAVSYGNAYLGTLPRASSAPEPPTPPPLPSPQGKEHTRIQL